MATPGRKLDESEVRFIRRAIEVMSIRKVAIAAGISTRTVKKYKRLLQSTPVVSKS